jgi:hypothetical protein
MVIAFIILSLFLAGGDLQYAPTKEGEPDIEIPVIFVPFTGISGRVSKRCCGPADGIRSCAILTG